MAKYEVEFLRLSRYARAIVATEHDKCVRFEEGLWYELMVLIAQIERVFAVLVDKVKAIKEFKHTMCEKKEKKKVQDKAKREMGSTGSVPRPKSGIESRDPRELRHLLVPVQ